MLEDYQFFYYVPKNPENLDEGIGGHFKHSFKQENDDKAREYVKKFIKGTIRRPVNLLRVVNLEG